MSPCPKCGHAHSAVCERPAVGRDPRALRVVRDEPQGMPEYLARVERDALALQVGALAVVAAVFVLLCWALS